MRKGKRKKNNKSQAIKIHKDEKPESVEKKMKLTKWFLEKKLVFGTRQTEEIFLGQLASRIIDILENEPEHEIAKILKVEETKKEE